ncbi:hypothetical protein BV25DRAFT_1916913 [Artomyces pyxidatus]|uniref:Uncharacterized protein n=1 Tax=Artomyces pyxidatus TaxID=48021 RepID=A0ACB8T0Q5_9AGAM|nr:hypothetical protein BV25DRAFT_1916913 [Artomyces pyxidatus]
MYYDPNTRKQTSFGCAELWSKAECSHIDTVRVAMYMVWSDPHFRQDFAASPYAHNLHPEAMQGEDPSMYIQWALSGTHAPARNFYFINALAVLVYMAERLGFMPNGDRSPL